MKREYKILVFFLIIMVILLFGANNLLLITDSVESNYALTAKEMVLSNDWISPQIYGQYWYDKPIFFYWLTALSFKMFGFNEFAARFFPAVFGVISVFFTFWAGKKLYSTRTGIFSSIILLSTIEFFLISKSIITDSILFLFFNATLLFFYLGYKEKKAKFFYGMYIFAALATLTKGPIGFLLPGLIIFLFLLLTNKWRDLKDAKLISGTFLFLLLVLPWYLVMYHIHGMEFINVFFGTHNFLRATVSEHPRDNVFYYYTIVNLVAFFPWVGFLPNVIKELFKQKNDLRKIYDEKLYLVIWAITIFAFFQLVATKYITYTYPLLFPLSLLVGNYLDRKINVFKFNFVIIYNIAFYFLLLFTVFYLNYYNEKIELAKLFLILFTFSIFLCTIISIYCYIWKEREKFLITIASLSLIMNFLLVVGIAVPLTNERSAKELAVLTSKVENNSKNIYVFGEYPTSAVFYLGENIKELVPSYQIEKFKPKTYSWSSKNVMPYLELEKLSPNNSIVFVKDKYLKSFLKDRKNIWRSCYITKNGWNILEKKI